MAKPESMEVLEAGRVAPPGEAAASETSLPLTFFDVLWMRFPPVERLFFYEFPHPPSSFFHSLLPKLKLSLSHSLHHFLPLAGNILWPPHSRKPSIRYVPGDGVSLTVAESNADFYLLSGSDFAEAEEIRLLVPDLPVSDEKASLMSLQITLFPNSGFSVGITTHHATADGKTSTLFMKSWAYLCSNLGESSSVSSLPENMRPSFDRSVIKDPAGIAEIFANFWLNQGGPNNRSLMLWDLKKTDQGKLIRGTFELLPSNIQKLKKSAESKLNNNKFHISTFSVTFAYVLNCLVKAEQTKHEKVMFLFSADCRSRLDPPIPSAYFGNCIGAAKAEAETKNLLGDNGFITALEAISEALKRLDNEAILSVAETWISDMETFGLTDTYRMFSAAGSPRFQVYSNDFGLGRPKKVEIVSIDRTGAISLAESGNGNGGIEFGLVLNGTVMEAFSAIFLKGLSS
ncbi:phenolic glucoside malonyltransferase 1-like [Prosopis cineraria]|uniref:phenolic glucoside malonyltransferase 1-like n=1 Tax=Prosopis cineraria TaxID=364024 RepID=UPI00240F1167|nr:phenolic glucoside malonyltransferase 1-like [Prosopis cineraria]XP_054808761.1 phenolic glucoside malonyltransferase 1-like [Prosopis cineraria]